MSKLIITQNIDTHYKTLIQDLIPDWEIVIGRDSTIWLEHLQDADVILGWKNEILEQCLQQESKLQWVQSWSAGVNSMPLQELEDRNILLTSANGVHAYPISETIFALMLGLTRKIHTYVKNQQEKKWHHSDLKLEIHEKTVGVIGVGAIGRETAKIAKAFGMNVLGVRNSGKSEDFVDEMYSSSQLHEVLPKCDYVVVTLPLTKDTHHLFGAKEFREMKDTSFFINIGRGEIVKEEELIEALRSGEIAGAGLDVFTKEPLQADSPLWNMENVIITPHTSGSTENYTKRVIEDIFIPNLKHYINGKKLPLNLVDYKKGY
ncbi:D-2-hydroxyacid dehydrogenase [Fredinandcohnia humi]